MAACGTLFPHKWWLTEEQKPFCYSFHFSYSPALPVMAAAALCAMLLLAASSSSSCLFQKAFTLLSLSGCLIPSTFCQQVFCSFVFVKVLGALPPPLPPPAVPTGLSLAHIPGEQESTHPALPALSLSVPNTYSCQAHGKAAPALLSTPETQQDGTCPGDPVQDDEIPLAQQEGTVGSWTLSTAGWHWPWALRAAQAPTGSQALLQLMPPQISQQVVPSGHILG